MSAGSVARLGLLCAGALLPGCAAQIQTEDGATRVIGFVDITIERPKEEETAAQSVAVRSVGLTFFQTPETLSVGAGYMSHSDTWVADNSTVHILR